MQIPSHVQEHIASSSDSARICVYFLWMVSSSSSLSFSMSIISFFALSIAWMSSSSLRLIACASRFWVFWIRKTLRNVMIVVPVLMTSC